MCGERSMSAFFVGAAPLVATQRLTGGSRPYETGHSANWHPLRNK
jgi:hypothetical protein